MLLFFIKKWSLKKVGSFAETIPKYWNKAEIPKRNIKIIEMSRSTVPDPQTRSLGVRYWTQSLFLSILFRSYMSITPGSVNLEILIK